jgi:rod shape-determining protein MreD
MAERLGMNPLRILAALTPAMLAMLAAVIANLPVSVTGGLIPVPVLALAPVYFWTLVRPDLMPPFVVLALGLLEDLLSGGPPGVWAGGFLAAYVLADRQRDFFAGLSGAAAVLGFGTVMLMAAATAYAVSFLAYGRFTPFAPLLAESLVTIVFYPFLAVMMGWAQRHLVGAFRGDD